MISCASSRRAPLQRKSNSVPRCPPLGVVELNLGEVACARVANESQSKTKAVRLTRDASFETDQPARGFMNAILIPSSLVYANNSFTSEPSFTIFTGRLPGASKFFSG